MICLYFDVYIMVHLGSVMYIVINVIWAVTVFRTKNKILLLNIADGELVSFIKN